MALDYINRGEHKGASLLHRGPQRTTDVVGLIPVAYFKNTKKSLSGFLLKAKKNYRE
jgi:hypothetical protein